MPIEGDMVVSRYLTYRLREFALRIDQNGAEPWMMAKGRRSSPERGVDARDRWGGSCNKPHFMQ